MSTLAIWLNDRYQRLLKLYHGNRDKALDKLAEELGIAPMALANFYLPQYWDKTY